MVRSNKLNEVIETSLKNLSEIIDVNTVLGKPVSDKENNVIIPVSKVSFGVLSGGGEYGKSNLLKKGDDLPYSAGNGSIVSIKPCCFLINDGSGYRVLNAESENSFYDKALELLTNISKNKS